MNKIKLSVILPCYNEEKRFKKGFEHFYKYLIKTYYSWELILVNDGSVDKTLQLMIIESRKDKRIKIVNYKKNRGKGYAIKKGVNCSQGKILLFSDIDHSVEISTIKSFFPHFKNHNVVIGSRRLSDSKLIKRQNKLREFLGKGFTLLVRILIDSKIKDATCGFKAFENRTAKKIFRKVSIYGWAFDAEVLFLCKKNKIDYVQTPVRWLNVDGSKVSLRRDILTSLLDMVKIRISNLFGAYD